MATIRKFGRRNKHRNMMMKNQLCSLIINGSIVTTQAKAKELKRTADLFLSRVSSIESEVEMLRFAKASLPDVKAIEILRSKLPSVKSKSFGMISLLPFMPRSSDLAPRMQVNILV